VVASRIFRAGPDRCFGSVETAVVASRIFRAGPDRCFGSVETAVVASRIFRAGPDRCFGSVETAVVASRIFRAGPDRCFGSVETAVVASRIYPAGPDRCLGTVETAVVASRIYPAGPDRCFGSVETAVVASRIYPAGPDRCFGTAETAVGASCTRAAMWPAESGVSVVRSHVPGGAVGSAGTRAVVAEPTGSRRRRGCGAAGLRGCGAAGLGVRLGRGGAYRGRRGEGGRLACQVRGRVRKAVSSIVVAAGKSISWSRIRVRPRRSAVGGTPREPRTSVVQVMKSRKTSGSPT
jgi:uncharacterized membrane protein